MNSFIYWIDRFQILIGSIIVVISIFCATYYFSQNNRYSYHRYCHKDNASEEYITVIFDKSSGESVVDKHTFINGIGIKHLSRENLLKTKPHYLKASKDLLKLHKSENNE